MEVRQLAGAIGAELLDVDLHAPNNNGTYQEIRDALWYRRL